MAKQNNFSVYAEESLNVIDDLSFKNLQARKDGALLGAIASSGINNTALKQTSLMVTALADRIASKLSIELGSNKSVEELSLDIENMLKSYLPKDLSDLTNNAGYSKSIVNSGRTLPSGQELENMKIGDIFILFED